ncbi:hypothetical protein RB620_19815 [Paenibacillus sp. LHD-117]|uniref:hypothetical protein n=1 Tax=Paenibacillus sp. LHD-117 TaxID=3071412 RepID=UPI0027DF16E5|nr:hypothetical protein [Paenibacillus sp. LHD-117]MDQ6421677.1 hypothetical protein [Paenibacillus sp. LHD-117]
MASDHKDSSKIFDDIKREFLHFANGYASAVKSGANAAGKQLIEALVDLDQPSNIPAGKLMAAVKTGVQHAGEQIIKSGMEYFHQTKKNNSKD